MNSILQLKGRFEKRANTAGFGHAKLPANKKVSFQHIHELQQQLKEVQGYWINNRDIDGALVSVHYSKIIAKSNRLKSLLEDTGKKPVDSICGARFVTEKNSKGNKIRKHIFTHYVQLTAIQKAISTLSRVGEIIESDFNGIINAENIEVIGKTKHFKYKEKIDKTRFINAVIDAFFVESFSVDEKSSNAVEDTLVTIYKTGVGTKDLLKRFGISLLESKIIDETTFLLDAGQLETLYQKAPYLIAMSVTDFTKVNLEDLSERKTYNDCVNLIPKPGNEPIIGVIDTHFDEKVYFHEWVDYKNMMSKDIVLEKRDYAHGTAVSSIIVDGPKGNPLLDDGCGRFKVRHFGVATHEGFSSFAILRAIRAIVASNQDIKVWNLSLGSSKVINENCISPEAAELDRIQNEYDVIFVVAGTNKPEDFNEDDMKIGAPADSLNAIVVNSVDMKGNKASYARKGPVLSFFHKPDLSYYGGDGTKAEGKIAVCVDALGAVYQAGTSFAAPWISRKMAYLIHVMGFSREIAKALLLDAAAGWNANGNISDYLGYGIVPKRIENILGTTNDEIKFFLTGVTEDYETYNYNLPIPVVSGKHPFLARAIMTYFPSCNRNQGVDYTSSEMDIHFGRVQTNKKLKTIDDNKQAEEGIVLYEEDARNIYRKWDNVKRLCEKLKTRAVPRKAYGAGMWGISVLTKDRISSKNRKALPFGLVITLKEMNGKNRIDEFIKNCMAHGWLVNRIDVQNQVDIYVKAEEKLEFE